MRAAILVCTGASDPFVTREHRSTFEEEMIAANADWQLHVHANAVHGFTERGVHRAGARYDEATDRRTWHAMRAFLDEKLPT